MRTTLNIDDDLYAKAVELTGVHEKAALLGGSEPDLEFIPRRQAGLLK